MFSISFDTLTKGEKIGEGGFGIVYKGTYQFALAAIKQLRIDNLSPQAEEEFNKEANIMAQLRHPNIVHFYGYCSIPKCLVMEYMPKGSLFKVLHSKESLDWNIRMRIATEIVSGLAFLHSRDILHRDIKSLNVLLDAQMGAKLTDFGLSKIKNETKSQTTANKTNKDSVGTIQWMAPELFKRRAIYTPKSDIYSLGITFWELASRKIPYAEDSQGAIPAFVQQGEREDIPQDCPEKLSYLIQQCWANDPSVRPSAPEIARFMTTDAKTLQELQARFKSPALESTGYQLTSQISPSFTPYQDNLNSNPELPGFKNLEITPLSSNSSLPPQRRGSNILNLADKKEEQEKIRYVLKALRTFFIEERHVGERTENYDVYNEHLKKANSGVQLTYQPTQNKHILYVNDEPLEAEAAAKELSKILKSLTPSNVAAKPTVSPVVQPAAVNPNPIQSQAASPIMLPTPIKAPEQKNSPMLIQSPRLVESASHVMNASELKELQDFLKLVAEGEQDKAEAMLKQNPILALTPTEVTDLSKRTFKNITALQYALWALDWHMWTMLLKYIPQKEASEQIAQSEQGLWIRQHGVTANWKNLIQALNQYVSEVRSSSPKVDSDRPESVYDRTWVKQVGGAQLLLPAHVINEYCHPSRPFEPLPDFTKPEVSGAWRTRSTDEGEWFSAEYGGGTLGYGFAVFRERYKSPGGAHSLPRHMWVLLEQDSRAVAALLETRLSQRAAVAAQYLSKPESTMLKPPSLAANIPAKSVTSPIVQSPTLALTVVNALPVVAQAVSPVVAVAAMMPAAKVNPPEQKNSPMFIQFPAMIKPIPHTMNSSELEELQYFLKLVAEGKQNAAEWMLEKNPALALMPTDVTDLSKRTFKNITALQYALWGLDWHMWTMLLKYIPQKEASEQIAQSEQGLWISQHGTTANWDNLIQAYQTTIDLYNKYANATFYRNKRLSEVNTAWVQQVGGAQLLLPAHVINEYCHPSRAFYPTPDFTKPEVSGWRTFTTDKDEWFSAKYDGGTLGVSNA